jgi:hypothetical protein
MRPIDEDKRGSVEFLSFREKPRSGLRAVAVPETASQAA